MAGFPPKRATAFSFEVNLVSQTDTDIFKTTVTLAAGDIQVSKDGAQYANLATFPPSEILLAGGGNSGTLLVTLTALEMTADRIAVLFHDVAGNEWQDYFVEIFTDTAQVSSAVLGATQGAITWGQQKIVANAANEGALDIRNSNAAGHGTLNDGGNVGLYNSGASTGQYNFGTADYGIQAGGGTSALNATPVDQIADQVWDEILTGATHNIATSAGRRLRQIAGNIIYDGTVVSSTGNTIRLDAGTSAVNGAYDPSMIMITGGTGEGQCRLVLEYIGASHTAVVDRDWKVNPVAGDTFVITGDPGREHVNEGLAQAGSTASTIKLNALASSQNDAYIGQRVFIRSGTGADQARRISDYDGGTKIATVTRDWDITPDATSAYVMLPTGTITDLDIAHAVWDAVMANYLDVGSTGETLNAAGGATLFPAGAINFTYTVTDSVTTLPIEGVEVWISTDNPAVNIVWKGDTDAFGVARDVNGDLPALDAGTYYFWRQKATYTFLDPDTEVVS